MSHQDARELAAPETIAFNAQGHNRKPTLLFGPLKPPGDQFEVQQLLKDSLEALELGNYETALRAVDVRCRLPFPRSAHFLMRARLRSLLMIAGEGDDLATAYELDPTLEANQSAYFENLAKYGDFRALSDVLTRLVRTEPELSLLGKVFSEIGLSRDRLYLGVTARDDRFQIWGFSGRADTINLSITSEQGRASISLPLKPLPGIKADAGYGSHVDIPANQAGRYCQIDRVPEHGIVLNRYALARGATLPIQRPHQNPSAEFDQQSAKTATIIIPVYADAQATRQCVESLLADPEVMDGARIILIDDASPLERLTSWLEGLARNGQVELVRNEHNLGFVGSINRVLAHTATTDTVLLNADTLLPKGWLGRLKAHAYSDEVIGTVTPLTNSGDFLSFPFPQPPRGGSGIKAVEEADKAFLTLFPGQRLTIPTGIGFCLFIKKACREQLGLLDDHGFLKGYLEEVDYCLRARKIGFRHVCALDTFVGHIGSASFGKTKRSYVVKNSAEILRRYPEHQREMEDFRLELPLKPYFGKAERELLKHPDRPRRGIIVGTYAEDSPIVQDAIARALLEDGIAPLLFVLTTKSEWQVRSAEKDKLRSADASDLMEAGLSALPRLVSSLGIAKWHFVDLSRTPTNLFEDCYQRGVPYLVSLCEFPLETRGEILLNRKQTHTTLEKKGQLNLFDDVDLRPKKPSLLSKGIRNLVKRSQTVILPVRAQGVLATDPILTLPQLVLIEERAVTHNDAIGLNRSTGKKGQLALIGDFGSVDRYAALKSWVQRLIGREPWEGIVVIGPMLMPMDLLALGPITIFGEDEWANIDDLVAIHDIRLVAHLPGRIDFGSRPIHVRRTLPCAEFDYTELIDRAAPPHSHPRLLASLSDDEIKLADRLNQWFSWISETSLSSDDQDRHSNSLGAERLAALKELFVKDNVVDNGIEASNP